ncbi:hypothetical protein DM02DRAFT_657271 [Periconia macrospinosa]|uniref:Uncharacterized protein n=1 Tax=Periconia macrospinosa TaxID=97972 RepID=A0A2V1DJV0_9PLEO|nr:hypothetical protein DM02DRAFT_657271 [Periconia macrospinosa]
MTTRAEIENLRALQLSKAQEACAAIAELQVHRETWRNRIRTIRHNMPAELQLVMAHPSPNDFITSNLARSDDRFIRELASAYVQIGAANMLIERDEENLVLERRKYKAASVAILRMTKKEKAENDGSEFDQTFEDWLQREGKNYTLDE